MKGTALDRDHKYFNCTQDDSYNELEYRIKKYKKPEEVKAFLKEKCEDGTINYDTHERVISLIDKAGFELA